MNVPLLSASLSFFFYLSRTLYPFSKLFPHIKYSTAGSICRFSFGWRRSGSWSWGELRDGNAPSSPLCESCRVLTCLPEFVLTSMCSDVWWPQDSCCHYCWNKMMLLMMLVPALLFNTPGCPNGGAGVLSGEKKPQKTTAIINKRMIN